MKEVQIDQMTFLLYLNIKSVNYNQSFRELYAYSLSKHKHGEIIRKQWWKITFPLKFSIYLDYWFSSSKRDFVFPQQNLRF